MAVGIAKKICRVYSRPANGRRALALVLIGGFVALTPLGYASPPDPSWLFGLYDEADYDDVIGLLQQIVGTDTYAASDGAPARDIGHSLRALEILLDLSNPGPALVSILAPPGRAPPLGSA
jgi:hypothetical protein